jgi:hypothetical protein
MNSGTFREILSLPARADEDGTDQSADAAIRTVRVTETADKFYEWLHLVLHLSVPNTLDGPCSRQNVKEKESEWVMGVGMLFNG